MSRSTTHPVDPSLDEALDPELLAIAPPLSIRRYATLVVMAFTATCALLLAFLLRLDVAYLFTSATATEVGDVLSADRAGLPSNRFVRIEGAPMASNAVYYQRALGGGAYVTFSLAGQRDVWVQVPVDDGEPMAAFARRSFEGRLVRVGDLGGRFEAVSGYLAGTLHQPIDEGAYLLLADERPTDAWWALALVALVLSFVVIDAVLLVRWFSPLPVE